VNRRDALSATAFVLALAAGLSCSKNRAPYAPEAPIGPEWCYKGTTYAFKTSVVDPNGGDVEVRFYWGDSTSSPWSGLAGISDTSWNGLVTEGDTISMAHAWGDTGTYEVRVQAMDAGHLMSRWSDAHAVRVVLRRTPNPPQTVSGPSKGALNFWYTFTTSASHPDSVPLAIRFAWGDGDTTDWSPFLASGESLAMRHGWTVPGTYAVRAQARDTGNVLSYWSTPHQIVIRPPDTLCKWRLQLATGDNRDVPSSPAIGPLGTIYVGSPDSCLHAVDHDGTRLWRCRIWHPLQASPAVAADGTVYIGSPDNGLYAVLPTGTLKWRFHANSEVLGAPAIAADGTIYIGTNDYGIHAVNPDGSLRWHRTTAGGVTAFPVIAADGTIYLGTPGSLFAFNPDGTQRWVCGTGNGVPGSDPAVGADGTIYFGTNSGSLDFYALRPDGTVKWRLAGNSARSSPAVGAAGVLYFGSADGCFYALKPDRTVQWRYQTGGDIGAAPAIAADGTIYFGSADGCLYALNADGTLKWRFETDAPIVSSPTIGLDGTVYFTSGEGYLYALKGTSPLADSPWPKFHHDLENTGRVGGGR